MEKDWKNITVIDQVANKVEIEVQRSAYLVERGQEVMDFRLFGEEEDRVDSVTSNTFVMVYDLDFQHKSSGSSISGHRKRRLETSPGCRTADP